MHIFEMDVFIRSAVLEAVPNDVVNSETDIEVALEKGINFLGVVQRVKIGGKSLIVKTQPTNERRRELFNAPLLFTNEAQFYNRIRPQMLPLPKYLHVPNSLVAREDVLVFEDLRPKGFFMYPKGETTSDLAHAKLIIKAMAAFHASSFAMKHLHPKEYTSMKEVLQEVLFLRPGTPEYWQRYDNACAGTIKLMEEEFPEGGKNLDRCKKMLANAYELFTSSTDPEDPYAIIVHGDLWMNNMLFKYIEKDPVEVVFLDYQIARVASPITDLVYFLYICTDGEFRKKHYADLINLYYDSLTERLQILNSNAEKVFPRHAFQDHLKKYSKYGFACAMIMVPIMFAGEDALAAFEDPDKVDFDKVETPEPVRKRIREILIELVEMNYDK